MKAILVLLVGLFITTSTASEKSHHVCSGFAPENTMYLPESITVSAISKSSYTRVLDRLEKEYQPDFKARGKTLEIVRSWSDGTVNAQAWRDGDVWKIEMFGGMARYPSMTADAFMLVACHETGHHLGGAPKYTGDWASNEGQSDYFATLKCARRMIAASSEEENDEAMAAVEPEVQATCAAEVEADDQIVCMRVGQASTILAGVLADLGGTPKPKISTPDPRVVSRTQNGHPAAQCRLDTMYQGSLCRVTGDLSDTDPAPGTCYSRNVIRGGRPFCWFKP